MSADPDDLVTRLRGHEMSMFHDGCADCYATVMDDAADEIVALRERVKIRDEMIVHLREDLRKADALLSDALLLQEDAS
jgi:hypothetical protein